MKSFLLILEFIVSFTLIVAVLLHTAKGEGLGAIGGSAKLFSSQKDLESGLNRFTTIAAGLFMGLAVLLSIMFA